MSSITSPYIVTTPPRPLIPSTSQTSVNDESYPSWFLPVVIAGPVVLLLLLLIIVLYCRWKKGAPTKKVLPRDGSPIEKVAQKPRITYRGEPDARSSLRHPPPAPASAIVTVNDESSPRPAQRKLPVRENSMRKKVGSRENLIKSSTTRANPAYLEEESENESVSQDPQPSTRVVIGRRTDFEAPKQLTPPSILETLESNGEDEDEESAEESLVSDKDSGFTANLEQHSPARLPTVAVMSDTRPSERKPSVKFRQTVHPEPSLPPLDLKHTSLVGRVIEEEVSVQREMKTKADIERWRNKQRQREKKLSETPSKPRNKRASFTEKKAWGRAQQEIGSVLDPEAMQPVVRKKKRQPRRMYNVKKGTSDTEENVELRGFKKLSSPREEKVSESKVSKTDRESQSDSDISMGEARRRMVALIDDAFTTIKSASKKHSEKKDEVDSGKKPRETSQSSRPPTLYPRPVSFPRALPEPPPSHGRASVPLARHKRRFVNSQNSIPYPSQLYPGMPDRFSPRYPPPPPPPVFTRNPLVVWDPADKERAGNQSAYKPYSPYPYSYTDPSGKLHFTPVQQTPDGMGGLVWSPYSTEYAMEDFYRNVGVPGAYDGGNGSFMSKMQETPLNAAAANPEEARHTVIDMTGSSESGLRSEESAEPLVRAIKDELFRLASGRTPVKHL